VELPDDGMEMSKHVGVSIDYIKSRCCDICFCYINYALVGYNKNNRPT
jgi:hypothetical protein